MPCSEAAVENCGATSASASPNRAGSMAIRSTVFLTSGVAHHARAYWGPYAISKAALDALARTYAAETASSNVRVNLFSPGPIRTRMRATVMPGEDPLILDTPEQAAELIVPLCLPTWNETGKVYDYPSRTLNSFRAPA